MTINYLRMGDLFKNSDDLFKTTLEVVSLAGFTTDELIAELVKRSEVTIYPRWVTADDVFGHRETFPGDRILLMVKKE